MKVTRIEVECSEDLRRAVEDAAKELGVTVEAFVAAYLQGVLYTRAVSPSSKASA